MNNANFVGVLLQDPELRYTSDNQTPVTTSLLQFMEQGKELTPRTIKLTAWGQKATALKEEFRSGDRIAVQGSLRINTIERPEGFKESRVELQASQIYSLGTPTEEEPLPEYPA